MKNYIIDWGRNLSENQLKYIKENVDNGKWELKKVHKKLTGLSRDHYIFLAERSGKFIKFAFHGDKDTFCPPRWADLAIGSGACGFGCRSCFLMLTFRIMRDPLAPVVYTNDFEPAVKQFLSKLEFSCEMNKKERKMYPATSLGLGIDCSDSLLYEGVTGNARKLIPLFAEEKINKFNKKFILLTKSANVQHLEGLPTKNIIVSFSLNPEKVADAWEGKYPDTNERITPLISKRLEASKKAEEMGFEVRWRLDPILEIKNWQKYYLKFFEEAERKGHHPTTITLGTYREKNQQLDTWRKKWELPVMELLKPETVINGTHRHLESDKRIFIYNEIISTINEVWNGSEKRPLVSLCKETSDIRKECKMNNNKCNCLDFHNKLKFDVISNIY